MMATVARVRRYSDTTVARGCALAARLDAGERAQDIMTSEGIGRGSFYRYLRAVPDEDPPPSRPARSPPRRMSERAFAHRAVLLTMASLLFRELGNAAAQFWLLIVMEIYRQEGPLMRPRGRLAAAAGGTEDLLTELIECELLIEDANGGIDLPYRYGLRPREPAGGAGLAALAEALVRQDAANPRPSEDRRQRFMMTAMDGGRSETAAKVDSQVDSRGGKSPPQTPPTTPENGPVSPAPSPVAGGEGTTTTTKDSDSSLGGGGGESFAAREREPAGESSSESSKIPPGGGDIPGVETALAAELLALAGRSGPARPPELVLVRAWLETKTANEIREAIGTRMEQRNAVRAPDLSYFDKRVREWAPRLRVADATPAPRPPELPEDPAATIELIHPQDPDNARLVERWGPGRAVLRSEVPEAEYRSWLRHMKLGGLDGDEIVMLFASSFARDWVSRDYGDRINAWWKGEYPEAHRVVFRVAANAHPR